MWMHFTKFECFCTYLVFVPFTHSVEKWEILSLRKISWNQLNKTLLSRNFCQKSVKENFRNFHTVIQMQIHCGKQEILCYAKFFPWNQFRGKVEVFSENVDFTEFVPTYMVAIKVRNVNSVHKHIDFWLYWEKHFFPKFSFIEFTEK